MVQKLLPGIGAWGFGVWGLNLGQFQVGSYRYRSLIEGLCTLYRSLIEALYTLNSPPAVPFDYRFQGLVSDVLSSFRAFAMGFCRLHGYFFFASLGGQGEP